MYHILLIYLYLISMSVFFIFTTPISEINIFMNPDNHIPPIPCYTLGSPSGSHIRFLLEIQLHFLSHVLV